MEQRNDYLRDTLNEADAGMDPIVLFRRWMDDAVKAGVPEPNAMTLATVGSITISCRVVLLRRFDANGFEFYTNYNSRKAMDLERDPRAALNFFWPTMERQVRIEGRAEQLEPSASDAYFASRPRASRISAWSSDQSRAVNDRAQLDARYMRWKERFADGDVPRPLHWGGYRVRPARMEFWQGGADRLHDRIAFDHLSEGDWMRTRLQP